MKRMFITLCFASKVLAQVSFDIGALGVGEICFARSHGFIGPGLPARVVLADIQILPEALELVGVFGSEC